MGVRVASASETIACERATMDKGTSSAQLMKRAGAAAAREIVRLGDFAGQGVVVLTGSGNNGGDGWIVAAELVRAGFNVRVNEIAPPESAESVQAREAALTAGVGCAPVGAESELLIVDALLGTGASGAPRGAVADAIGLIGQRRSEGARVISLDVPSGLDATTGEHEGAVRAEITLSFGNVKRGHLLARDVCGTVVALDIGLDAAEIASSLPLLIDAAWAHERIPRIPVAAHKGTRRRLAIVGGGPGMAGAAILAGEGALRSGIGLLRIVAHPSNTVAIHAGIPAAIVQPWPEEAEELETLVANADVIALGPGLGSSSQTRDLVERVLLAWSGPVVLDADAINVFAGDAESLRRLLAGRAAVITPHPAELARFLGVPTESVLDYRFDVGLDLSEYLGAVVLLKGTPTVIFLPDGRRYVSAAGTAALATGGSGDVLTGMVATLIAQMCLKKGTLAGEAAACAAFIHGRAAELSGFVRGVTLADILQAMPTAWNEQPTPLPSGVLTHLVSYS